MNIFWSKINCSIKILQISILNNLLNWYSYRALKFEYFYLYFNFWQNDILNNMMTLLI